MGLWNILLHYVIAGHYHSIGSVIPIILDTFKYYFHLVLPMSLNKQALLLAELRVRENNLEKGLLQVRAEIQKARIAFVTMLHERGLDIVIEWPEGKVKEILAEGNPHINQEEGVHTPIQWNPHTNAADEYPQHADRNESDAADEDRW